MSIEGLTAFFARLQEDTALRDQAAAFEGAGGAERLDGLCRLAREHGFEVTPEDWAHEAAGPAVAALDDESLRRVAGGVCYSPGVFGGPHEGAAMQGI
jgi:predicted ribosomally synthesized peptide with nif11-like leader